MSKTKIYIQYIPKKKSKWFYASFVVSKVFTSIEEATEYLDWGNAGNWLIDDLSYKYSGLKNWEVIEIESTDSEETEIYFGDKAPTIKRAEKTERETKKIQKETETLRNNNEKLIKQTEELREKNIQILIEDWGLTREEAIFGNENMDRYMEQIFRVTPNQIKTEYAESLEVGKGDKVMRKLSEDARKYVNAESKPVDKYIQVLDKYVPFHLFYDYIIHLSTDIKRWDAGKYENRRCVLHQRIFVALGGDRIKDRDSEICNAIEKVIGKVFSCTCCGKRLDSKGWCDDCQVQHNSGSYLSNLNDMAIHK